jgi:hypothetical protein
MIGNFLIGYAVYYCNPIILLYLTCYFLRLRYYFISEQKERMLKMMARLNQSVWTSCTKNASGKEFSSDYFVGWSAFGYIDHSYDEIKLYIITTPKYYAELIKCDDVVYMPPSQFSRKTDPEKVVKPQFVEIYVRRGMYKNFFYSMLRVNLSNIEPIGDQVEIVAQIVALFRQRGQAAVFLHGVSNAGKSMVAYLVAKELTGKICHTFNPTDPGDQIHNVVADAAPTDDSPLVLVLEEVDGILENVHKERVKLNKDVPTSVYQKSGWCNFLDNMIFFKNVILVMTSNRSKEEIDGMDPAYLRKGRLHAEFRLDRVIDDCMASTSSG